jgi:hypothetical protein
VKARRGLAVEAWPGPAKAWHGSRGIARPGLAWRGSHGWARQGLAWPGEIWPGMAVKAREAVALIEGAAAFLLAGRMAEIQPTFRGLQSA